VLVPDIDTGGEVVRSLIAYSEVNVGVSTSFPWYLVVSTPASDAFLFTGVFYTDQLMSLIYFIIVILAFSIIGTASGRYKKTN
jgi:hypothetical protein